jgi:hypothetical protein
MSHTREMVSEAARRAFSETPVATIMETLDLYGSPSHWNLLIFSSAIDREKPLFMKCTDHGTLALSTITPKSYSNRCHLNFMLSIPRKTTDCCRGV